MGIDYHKLYEFAKIHWQTPIGLFASIALALLIESLLFITVSISGKFLLSIYGLTFVFLCIVWFNSRRIHKTKKGRVGFAVCLSCTSETETATIHEDFIRCLQDLIKTGKAGRSFDFFVLPSHIAEKTLDHEDAMQLRAKCRAHFLIYGRVRVREINENKHHVLNLEGVVTHKPIPQEASDLFSKEFAELFPRRLQIHTENDLFSFEFTAYWMECVAKYIIGIAAALSHDYNYAEALYQGVLAKVGGQRQSLPSLVKLQQRVPLRLSEIHEGRARDSHVEWTKTRDPRIIDSLCFHLSKIEKPFTDRYSAVLLKSICLFLKNRDIQGAIRALKKCRKPLDGTLHLNLAFLYGYSDDLRNSIRHYRASMNYEIVPKAIEQVEGFICWILEEEPTKYQLSYCLAFFNWKLKGDLVQASKDFQNFLQKAKENEFIKEQELAQKWLKRIKDEMNSEEIVF